VTEGGIYLYAVARGLPPHALDGEPGLADQPLRSLELAGLQAVLSDVDLADFGEEGLRRNLEDLGWLEQVARRHDDVVSLVAGHAPVAPMRLATVFLGEESLRERLHEWAAGLHAALDRVEGCQEWSVKVFVDTAGIDDGAGTTGTSSGGATSGPGAAYLQRRRQQLTAQERAQEEAARVGDAVHEHLSGGVVASRRLPPQDRRLGGYEGTMVLNAAYLVSAAGGDTWRAGLEEIRERYPQARMQLDGPWPPYSFATLDSPA
jgi:hypothetical protein